ncbi:protein Mp4R-MYB1 [Marchantia polymorpha subsp. ruderalis]
MVIHAGDDSEEEDDDEDIAMEEGFQGHLDALKRACLLNIGQDSFLTTGAGSLPDTASTLEEDDEELFESIQKKYFLGSLDKVSIPQGRPSSNSDDEDEEQDDEEILRSVEKLYSVTELSRQISNEVDENAVFLEVRIDSPVHAGSEAPDESSSRPEDSDKDVTHPVKDLGRAVSTLLPSNWNEEEDPEFNPPSPNSAVVAYDPYKHHTDELLCEDYGNYGSEDKEKMIGEALQKNLSYQQNLRNILNRIESKQKHNAEMQRRVRTLLDFEKYCKRKYAVFFTDQANPSLKLFSVGRGGYQSRNDDKSDYHPGGPPDNADVEVYKMLKQKATFASMSRRWRAEELRELAKGVKQQIYEVLVCEAMDAISNGDIIGDNALENALSAIRNKELTPEEMRNAIADVNWNEVARVYVVNRTPEECRTRWLNHEDPLINKSSWTKTEDKKLLSIAQRNKTTNWEKIAQELGTNRTPAECLTRYQRSLNASIMRSVWTPEEDAKLRAAVEELGESDWSLVAACLEGRNNSQCLMRWYKVLHPRKQKKGRWSVEEDKRLNWAVSLHGARKWKQIANHVPGRTDIQCRERWCNVLNPDIKLDTWTEEEDQTLRESVALHGPHRWSAIATDLKVRTDKQCWRRWKILFPEEQPDYKRTVFIQRNALIGNFQGRKKERPKLGPQDFVSKADTFGVPSNIVRETKSKRRTSSRSAEERTTSRSAKKRTNSRSAKKSSVSVPADECGRNSSTPTTAASIQRDSAHSSQDQQDSTNHEGQDLTIYGERGTITSESTVIGALEEVSVNGNDTLADSKLRRLARIHKLKLSRANKLANSANLVLPRSAQSTRSTPDNQSEYGQNEVTDPSSSAQVQIEKKKGRKRSRTEGSDGLGNPSKRPRKISSKRTSDVLECDIQSSSQLSEVSPHLSSEETEPSSSGGLLAVTDGAEQGVTNGGTAEVICKSKKRSRVSACPQPRRVSKRRRPDNMCLPSRDSDIQTAAEEPPVVRPEPGPAILSLVDLVHSINEFCKYTFLLNEEQHVQALPDPDVSDTAVRVGVENITSGSSALGPQLCPDPVQERYLRLVHDHDTPFVDTESIPANGHGCRTERRMVASKPTAGGACDALWCPNSGVNRIAVRSDGEGETRLITHANTESNMGGVQDGPSRLSPEDEEVAAATKAILSWPFFYGVQQLTLRADEYLNSKAPRKSSTARPPKSTKKGKSLGTSETIVETQPVAVPTPVTAVDNPVSKRPRSARCAARMRGTSRERTSEQDS